MPIEMGCCEAKQAMQEYCECKRQIGSLLASSSSDAQRIRDIKENQAVCGLFVIALFVFLCASLVAACAEVNRTRSQIDRLNADVDFLESQVFQAGRRK
jgi:general stress protein 26